MIDLVVGLALVFVIEGLLWAAFPEQMKKMAARAVVVPSALLRRGGVCAMALGVVAIWLIRG